VGGEQLRLIGQMPSVTTVVRLQSFALNAWMSVEVLSGRKYLNLLNYRMPAICGRVPTHAVQRDIRAQAYLLGLLWQVLLPPVEHREYQYCLND
jgi:hypothetical protein